VNQALLSQLADVEQHLGRQTDPEELAAWGRTWCSSFVGGSDGAEHVHGAFSVHVSRSAPVRDR
jgi:hypothetical protein